MTNDSPEKHTTHLPMEYEQTVQTLRNWDSLFFNTFSSIIIAGGIGGIIAIGQSENFQYVRELAITIVTALYLIVVFYYLYNTLIASKKFEVLTQIEERLDLVGTYTSHTSRVQKYISFLFVPIFTLLYVLAVYSIWQIL